MVAKSGAIAAAVGAALMLCATGAWADEVQDRWDEQVRERRALESPVIAQFAGTLSRQGTTLTIVADNGTIVTFADRDASYSETGFYFVEAYIEPISSFLVYEMANADWSGYHLMHKRTGDMVWIGDEPEIEPDNREFVAINAGPSENGRILIGRETDTGLVIEAVAGITGYEFAGWIDADRIALRYASWMDHYLSKNEQEERGFSDGITRVAELVRQDEVWRLVEIISTPLASPEESDDAP